MFSSIAAALCTRCLFLLASAALAFSLATTTGDPTSHVLDPRAGKAERETLRHELKLDRPIATRLTGFIGSVVVGDLGRSWQCGQQVTQMIADAAPATLELTVVALLIALIAALPLAIAAASRPSSEFARAIRTLSLIAVGLPTFVTALLSISLFAAGFGLLPAFGRGATVNVLGWRTGLVTASGLMAVCLPAVTIAMTLTGYFVRVVECELRRVLPQDYITAARARGIGPRRLYFVHALAMPARR